MRSVANRTLRKREIVRACVVFQNSRHVQRAAARPKMLHGQKSSYQKVYFVSSAHTPTRSNSEHKWHTRRWQFKIAHMCKVQITWPKIQFICIRISELHTPVLALICMVISQLHTPVFRTLICRISELHTPIFPTFIYIRISELHTPLFAFICRRFRSDTPVFAKLICRISEWHTPIFATFIYIRAAYNYTRPKIELWNTRCVFVSNMSKNADHCAIFQI